ncbi:MAG: DUF4956 domain-containing protein [Vallitalea sp.]|jgi:uncharacterized membrane protein YhiD involved in acid resistance|nr:DUF4956 domain-containing protein [Vallitalea sp.]
MNKLDLAEFLSSTSKGLSYERITFNMLMTLVLVIFIYWVYKKTYSGVMYSKNFNITIMLISTVTAMVMMVIGSNLALSLGMVGALSIIRFRAAIKDPKDIGFLFWGIAVGLSAGTGSYGIALIGSIIIAIILFVFNIPSNEEASYLLIIKGNDIKIDKVTEIIKKNVPKYKLRMKSTNPVSQEIIYEVNLRKVSEDELMKELKKIKQISTLNIVSHNGEVAGN